MNTPICDFVRRYAENKDVLRLHMPGHKGQQQLGAEPWDITEIPGADSLYEASGIIKESEENASRLFGCPTLYSTEGSSQCIRAMLYLALLAAPKKDRRPLIAAARNVHKTFFSAAALLDFDVLWLCSGQTDAYLACPLDAEEIEQQLKKSDTLPVALYITSPDYLGNLADIPAIAAVCRKYQMLLLVDNAHGAYLRFLLPSRHPIDLGADLCCDSAHKTLPVLTGGAYLHLSAQLPAVCLENAKQALALFGSTSPSYLILQSLDAVNPGLAEDYPQKLQAFIPAVQTYKEKLEQQGYRVYGKEPLKLTLRTKPYGYTGAEIARMLEAQNIFCEFSDPDFIVFMLTPAIGQTGLERLYRSLCTIPRRPEKKDFPPPLPLPPRVLSIRQALFSAREEIPAEKSCGRILAAATVSCPPAVPIVGCGERIEEAALKAFSYYGLTTCSVVKENSPCPQP